MEDLYAAFLPQFLALARTRVARAVDAVTRDDREAMAAMLRDLHALAGEAGLLGLTPIITLARDSEDKARSLLSAHTEDAAAALASSLDKLAEALKQMDQQPRGQTA